MAELMLENNIILPSRKSEYLRVLFESNIVEEAIIQFIRKNYRLERALREREEPVLIDQLSRLQTFDWGGSYQNGLEKNIVDNYVKRIKNFDELNNRIDTSILDSVRGYTLNSWYNHWTSIIIEDIFKDHPAILPAIGKVSKIDFFIQGIPFDLKVTYFPEELMKTELKLSGYGNELTHLKRVCRKLGLVIPTDLPEKALRIHLYNRIMENSNLYARTFIADLNNTKKLIINKYKSNTGNLKRWFYENQGDKRFDASNRFFLVLIDEDNIHNSWKLKRKIEFLKKEVASHFNFASKFTTSSLITPFTWKDGRQFHPLSDILFLSYSNH